MKKILVVLMLVLSSQLFAADTTNCVVNKVETDYFLMYYGPARMGVAGGTDNSTTQWMDISMLDFTNFIGGLQVWCTDITGTEDINGYIQFSNSTTGTTFKELATDAGLDAISTTVLFDTVGVATGKKCFGAKYMRLKFDGQTSSPHQVYVNWYILCPKPDYAKFKSVGGVGNTL